MNLLAPASTETGVAASQRRRGGTVAWLLTCLASGILVSSGCRRPAPLRPDLQSLSIAQELDRATYVVTGSLEQCSPDGPVQMVEMSSVPDRTAVTVPFQAYSCQLSIKQSLRPRLLGSIADKRRLYIFRIQHPIFAGAQQERGLRLWFLRYDHGLLRPMTDRGISWISLDNVTEKIEAADETSAAISLVLLNPALAASWNSSAERLRDLTGLASELNNPKDVQRSLVALSDTPGDKVADAACVELYLLFDQCRDRASRSPLFAGAEARRKRYRRE